jgi:hypothetical protein
MRAALMVAEDLRRRVECREVWARGEVNDMISVADLAALVTVIGVSVYVAGLLGLTIAIRVRTLTDDILTAWYVVTLLPRPDVAGQGVKIWLTWPLPIALLIVMLDTFAEHFGISGTLDKITPFIGLMVLAFFLVLTLRHMKEEKDDYLKGHYIAATVIAAAGGLLMSEGSLLVVRGAREADIPVIRVLTHGEFFGLIVFIIGSLFVGVAGAAVLSQPLPRVYVDPDRTFSSPPPAFLAHDLYLVAHSEGHWHFVDDDENKLVSVPDRVVLAVHTTPLLRK